MPPPYNPVSRCIYCGIPEGVAEAGRLSDEHIIPYALGGTMVLPKASCGACANETHAFEGFMAGKFFEAARVHFGWKSRNRKRPKTLRVGNRDVPIEEHPPVLLLLQIGPPGILLNQLSVADKFEIEGVSAVFGPGFFKKLEPLTSIAAPFRGGPYMRTLAKIAHSFSVAELGFDGFDPLLTELILGKSDHWSHCVGQLSHSAEAKTSELHRLSLEWNRDLLVCRVQLYSKYGSPSYVVVAGRRKRPSA